MAGKFIRGALIQFVPTFHIPVPNVIVFQFNPETMSHSWTPAAPREHMPGGGDSNPLAVKGFPGESFSFTLAMDASDMIADGTAVAAALATSSGIYSRLAALELLLFPQPGAGVDSLVKTLSAQNPGVPVKSLQKSVARAVPLSTVPVALFVWGPGRIVPVRVTSLTITEKLHDPLLNPTHAEAQIGLTVVTPDQVFALTSPLGTLASVAYQYTQALRRTLALANLESSTESIIGMIPVG